jgi:protein XagA
MRIMLRVYIGCITLFLSLISDVNTHAYAGAWLRETGRSEIIFSNQWSSARQEFDARGKPLSIGKFSKMSSQITIEYGLTNDITMIAGLAGQQQRLSTLGLNQKSANVSGLAGARIKIWSSQHTVVSTQATSEFNGEQQSKLQLSRRFEPPASADLRLLLGHSFTVFGISSFVDLQSAYRWRGGSHANEVHLDVTLGARPFQKTLLLFQSFNTLAVERDQRTGLKPMRRHKLQTSLVYDVTNNLSLQAGVFMTVAGRESLRESGALLALWWKI